MNEKQLKQFQEKIRKLRNNILKNMEDSHSWPEINEMHHFTEVIRALDRSRIKIKHMLESNELGKKISQGEIIK